MWVEFVCYRFSVKLISSHSSISVLSKYSKHLESWVPFYEHFIPVADVHRPAGYLLRFPFYVQGPRHARILLSTTDKPELDRENAYEIRTYFSFFEFASIVRRLSSKCFILIYRHWQGREHSHRCFAQLEWNWIGPRRWTRHHVQLESSENVDRSHHRRSHSSLYIAQSIPAIDQRQRFTQTNSNQLHQLCIASSCSLLLRHRRRLNREVASEGSRI